MGFWSLNSGGIRVEDDQNTPVDSNLYPVLLTAGSGTYGPWYELIPSLPIETYTIDILIGFITESSGSPSCIQTGAFQLGIGASGSEIPITDDIYIALFDLQQKLNDIRLPIYIKKGERLSIRVAGKDCSLSGSQDLMVHATVSNYSYNLSQPGNRITTLGLTGFYGTAVASGSSDNAKGSWVSIGSVPHTSKAIAIGITTQTGGGLSYSSMRWFLDVAIGDASNKQIILENIFFRTPNDLIVGPCNTFFPFIPINIPYGTNIYIRQQAGSGSINPDSTLYCCVYLLE